MANRIRFNNTTNMKVGIFIKEQGNSITLDPQGSWTWEPARQDTTFTFEYWKEGTRQFLVGIWGINPSRTEYDLTLIETKPDVTYYVKVEPLAA
ncbi:MAG TPA: hypothetical protein VGS07_20205 [Thermoanaerobaculia bacterium]|jgi:hypothetical protein|nr:hypothetical protein [Thermoanaerobaculia bacterium]